MKFAKIIDREHLAIYNIHSGKPSLLQAAKLLNTNTYTHQKHHTAEVVVPQLKLNDLFCRGVGDEAAMFVKECLEVRFQYSHDYSQLREFVNLQKPCDSCMFMAVGSLLIHK